MGKIADLFIKLGLKKDEFDKGINEAKKQTDLFGSGIKKLGGMIAGAFAVSSIIAFGKELLMLGGQAEGVRAAFNRIADDNTLNDLKAATRGTVAELDLMERAVMASNFGIPVQNLGKLLEFATKRAQETGQSVDYLVDSIVTGIGRKSPLILDNLGISAAQLKEKLKGAGMETAAVADVAKAVGEIATDSMKKSGAIIDTNAIKVARLSTQWSDLKTQLAENKTVVSVFGTLMQKLSDNITVATSKYISFWEKLTNINGVNTDKLLKKHNDYTNAVIRSAQLQSEWEETITGAKAKQAKVNEELAKAADEQAKAEERKKAAAEAAAAAYKKQVEEAKKLAEATALSRQYKSEALTPLSTITKGAKVAVREDYTPEKKTVIPLEIDKLQAMQEKNKEIAASMSADWDNFSVSLDNTIRDNIAGSIDVFAESIGQLAVGDINLKGFFANILSQFGSFVSQMGKLFISFGVGKLAFTKALQSMFSGPAGAIGLIAAGATMVAIGGAIGGLAKKAGGSGSSAMNTGSAMNNYSGLGSNNQQLVATVKGRDLQIILERNSTYRTRT